MRVLIQAKRSVLMLMLVGGAMCLTMASSGWHVVAATGVMDDVTYQITNPKNPTNLMTTSTSEVSSAAANYGYSISDEVFLSSKETGTGLKPAKRYYKSSTVDFATESDTSKQQALIAAGYKDQGVKFYVSNVDTAVTEPVYRYEKNARHQYALSKSDQAALTAAGWVSEGVSFYAIPTAKDAPEFVVTPPPVVPPSDYTDGVFGIAVMPDTQQEAQAFAGDQYNERISAIIGQKTTRDLRFVAHTGDLISWGANEVEAPAPDQLTLANNAFNILDASGMPYLIALGNHDLAIVCNNGSACPSGINNLQLQKAQLRDTTVMNRIFPLSREKYENSFEGKLENAYRTFAAEGKDWLVLSIEMTPRQSALDWAKNVVATHPKHNVIVLSHYLIEEDGSMVVGKGNAGYGDLAPQEIYNQLILAYPNVKAAFCGHRGYSAAYRVDTGVAGNKVPTFIGTFHSNDYNPTRYVTFDVNNGTISSDIKAGSIRDAYLAANPTATLPTYDEFDVTISGMSFINR